MTEPKIDTTYRIPPAEAMMADLNAARDRARKDRSNG